MGNINGKPSIKDEDVEKLSKSNDLTPEEVRQNFEEFVEQYPDGMMNKDQFSNFMMKVVKDKDELDFLFRFIDDDNSGTINFMEFMTWMLLDDLDEKEFMTRTFRLYDSNRDGQISKKEVTKMMKDFSALNKLGYKRDAKETIAEFDQNDDGKINLEEFLKYMSGL